ncbi:hypothetical protein GmHk_17G049209 [Glycine max]|nr:hypothetical protein GmHk_17G049209 [Glycine max]
MATTIDLWCLWSLHRHDGGGGGSGSCNILNNLIILLNRSNNFLWHILLIMLGENLCGQKIALYLPRLLGNILRQHLLLDLLRQQFYEPFHITECHSLKKSSNDPSYHTMMSEMRLVITNSTSGNDTGYTMLPSRTRSPNRNRTFVGLFA